MNRSDDNPQETYGLKSLNCPLKIKEMVAFEKDLWHLVNKLKFQKNDKQLPETVEQKCKSNQMIKQSFSTCQ